MDRRSFLAFTGFAGAHSLLAPGLTAASPRKDQLKWRSDVIQVEPHGRNRKSPVVTGVALQPGGDLLAIVGDDHHVCLYDHQQQRFATHLEAHTDWIRSTRFTADGKRLITAGNDRQLMVWDTADLRNPVFQSQHREAIIDLAVSSDQRWLATVGFESRLSLYDLQAGKLHAQLDCACNDNHAVAISNDNRLIAAGGRNGIVRVWDLASRQVLAEFKAHRSRIRSLQFTPNSRLLSAGDDQMLVLSDLARHQQGVRFPRHASKLYSTTLLDGGLLATGGSDNKVHIWQMGDRTELGTLNGHTGTVTCLDFAGQKLVSGSYDTRVRLWHTESFTSISEPRQAFQPAAPSGLLK